MESFEELSLPEFLSKALKKMNFVKPTPVQAQAIPVGLAGKDVIASAQTGTGKTAAFAIPLLAYLENNKDKTALVMTPTRELAMQVLEVFRKFTTDHYLGGSVLLIGGANMAAQFQALARKPRLIIGTPGRIIDHLGRNTLKFDHTGFLVLDEADRMLDMGFAPQLEEIRKRLPAVRQTLLFSATFPHDIQTLGARYLKQPVRITVGSMTQPIAKIAQVIVHTTEARKFEELAHELKERRGSVLIFVRTQVRVDRLSDKLKDNDFKVTRIHGGRTQSQRRQAIEQFREGKFDILVATDIAARGLDIHHIAHVINYDLPRNPEDYVHRVGRTARAGAEGNSLCLLTPEDKQLWEKIMKLMGGSRDSVKVKTAQFSGKGPKPEFKAREVRPLASPRHEPKHEFKREHKHDAKQETPVPIRHRESPVEASGPIENSAPDRPARIGPKNRHADGRHQRRSEEHHKRMGQTEGQPSVASSNAPENEDRQPNFEQLEGQASFSAAQKMTTPWDKTRRPQNRSFDRNREAYGRPSHDRPRRPFGDRPRNDRPFRGGGEFRNQSGNENREVDGNKEQAPRQNNRPAYRSFVPRPGGQPAGDKPFRSENRFGGDRRPGGHRPGGERRPFKSNRPFGDRPMGDRKPFGERKPFRSDRPFGDRRPFNSGGPSGDRKPFRSDRPFGDKRGFNTGRPSGDRKPFRSDRSGGDRPFGDRPSGERRPFRPSGPGGGNNRPNRFGKPSFRPKTS